MRSISLLLWLAGCCFSFSSAQSTATISGFLVDGESGEALRYGQIVSGNKLGATANVYGYYSFQHPVGEVTLITYFGSFVPDTLTFFLSNDTSLTISLTPVLTLGEVEIIGQIPIQDQTRMSTHEVSIEKIRQMPAFLGEVDVLKALQMMPGVQGGNEGTTGLHVRGGNPSQNLILLDGVPLYYVNHLGGFFSIFDPAAIDHVELITCGFPASYGGRTSSVLDLRMKEGNLYEYHGNASLGIVSAKAMLEGPILAGKSSFLISARRTYVDLFTRVVTRANSDGDRDLGYQFYDINAKIHSQLGEKGKIFLSTYLGDDRLRIRFTEEELSDELRLESESDNRLAWGNQVVALRWNQLWGDRWFSNLTSTYTRYRYQTDFVFNSSVVEGTDTARLSSLARFQSGIREWGSNLTVDYYAAPNHAIKLGGEGKVFTFTPGTSAIESSAISLAGVDTTFGSEAIAGWAASVFVEDSWKPSSTLSFLLGTRVNVYGVEGTQYLVVEPRVSMRQKLGDQIAFKASAARMSQFVHLLSNSNAGIPTDLWVPSTKEIPIERSWTTAIGLAGTTGRSTWQWSVEAYYRTMDGLIEYKAGEILAGSVSDWRQKIESGGTGEMMGLEAYLEKKKGNTTGWLSYTLAWSNRHFPTLNEGREFPYKYDNRHTLNLFLTHQFSERLSLSGIWVFQSGNAVTLPTARHNTAFPFDATIEVFQLVSFGQIHLFEGGRNSFRFRSYHRLDLSLNHRKQKKLFSRVWSLGLYNAYGRRNPYFYFYDNVRVGGQIESRLKQFSLFPIVPAISYQLEF